MAHLGETLPEELALGARKSTDWGTEVVTTDGKFEVRNNRWSSPVRTFECSYPVSYRAGTVHRAVLALYELAEGMLHSFDMIDFTDPDGLRRIPVRFATPLDEVADAMDLNRIDTFTLVEVRL